MNHFEAKPILYEIECPLCNSVFTKKFNPGKPLTEKQLNSAKTVKQTQPCPICKKEITFELPAVLIPEVQVERVIRGRSAEE